MKVKSAGILQVAPAKVAQAIENVVAVKSYGELDLFILIFQTPRTYRSDNRTNNVLMFKASK